MIKLYTNQNHNEVLQTLQSVEGVTEAAQIKPLEEVDDTKSHIIVESDTIRIPIPWDGTEPPILFEPIPYDEKNLLAAVLTKLGYEEEALEYANSAPLREAINFRLQLGNLEQAILDPWSENGSYFSAHNHAMISYYAGHLHDGVSVESLFEQAISSAPTDEHAAFTAKHFAVLHLDASNLSEAEELLRIHSESALSESAQMHLNLDLIHVLMANQFAIHEGNRLEESKELVQKLLEYFIKKDIRWAVASLYSQAAELAAIENNYSEAISCVSKAMDIYEDDHLPEFLASAILQKGRLFYTWAQDSNPQFYQSAIDTYNESLKIFTKEHFPHVYAEIHHNLAVIYAEMPADEKKKTMWAAFSATSFSECLDYYQKDVYPHEYAMVANNYANALLKYPPAKIGDNAEKAVYYYLEALELRDAQNFPVERAHIILNYVEACWRVHNVNKTMERARYRDMLSKAKEVKSLVSDESLIAQAQAQLEELSAIGVALLKD